MSTTNNIVEAALAARTPQAAAKVQESIEAAVGGRHMRPLGSTWNNQGILTASGANYDHKLLETVTNEQDAVLELFALQKYGDKGSVPFTSPHQAAEALLDGMTKKEKAEMVTVTIDPATSGREDRRNITVTMRDLGCGIVPSQVLRTIFRVGAGTKNGVDWLQGTFGLGGATTYLNARNVVLVTRRHPDLLEAGEQDLVTVAVIDWEEANTTRNAFCLTTTEWNENRPFDAVPYSLPAKSVPAFNPGTHLALIGFKTNGLAAQSSDPRSFDKVFNTRLFEPVTPIRFVNNIIRDRVETFDGLKRRWKDNPPAAADGFMGDATMPFSFEGATFRLPIFYRVFAATGQAGEHRKFVAQGHALTMTSNGQVHAHWTQPDFRTKTKLNRLYNRVFVTVALDDMSTSIRSRLFTADRAQLVETPLAKKLESELIEHLNTLPALYDENNRLRREVIAGSRNNRPTIAVAEEIARAFKAKGFSLGGSGRTGDGSSNPPDPTPPEDLWLDPTHFEGPERVVTLEDRAKSVYYKLNAVDDFLGAGRRGQLVVSIDHPEIDDADITVDDLHAGRVRIKVPVPDGAENGTFTLDAEIADWQRSSGGVGTTLSWMTKFEIVDKIKPATKKKGSKEGKNSRDKGATASGGLVALIWASCDDEGSNWSRKTVGEVEMMPAADLAAANDDYKDLADLEVEIPTIVLNSAYSPFKKYIAERSKDISTEQGLVSNEDRYATGVGVGLLVLNEEIERRKQAGADPLDGEAVQVASEALARSVLSTMPYADRILKASME